MAKNLTEPKQLNKSRYNISQLWRRVRDRLKGALIKDRKKTRSTKPFFLKKKKSKLKS